MLIEGAVLGAVTLAGFGVCYSRLPKGVKVFMCRHPLLTDVVCAVFFYSIMGSTIIAHVGSAVMSLGVMGMLHIEKNPQDFSFLYDILAKSKLMMNQGLASLRDSCKKLSQEQQAPVIAE